ncbi:NitT/TauT family transport system permease protein [Sinosporangium album]|uniref:NitT/TauT family transport system permease protein n=1 Tax=Sinosporangium album TaxID=504805 RepID=A0A1G7VE06_9ACTN|nr:ABC transporter permease [Sinosporangium album]SDG57589.1 NitT/TauT family transport system permease protein [Sinosporangium album]
MTGARLVRGAVGVAGFLAVAELAVRSGYLDERLLPPPTVVVREAVLLVADPEFTSGLVGTVSRWLTGLALAIAIAVPAGVLLGTVAWAERATRPLLEFLRPIPSVALIPLAILLIPDDFLMKISVIVYASLWPILINTMYGLREVDPLAKDSLRSFGFGRLAVLCRVSLPSTAPFIVTGVRLSAGIALILAISAELLAGGAEGLGVFVIRAGSGNRTDLVIAAALWAGTAGVLSNTALVAAERRLFRWHHVRSGAVT